MPRRLMIVLSVLFLTVASTPARSDDPIPILRSIYGAIFGNFTVFTVRPGLEAGFQDAMLKFGPYNMRLSGFSNERIIESLPSTAGAGSTFFAVTRYNDKATSDFVNEKRDPALGEFLASEPVHLQGELVEHYFANWSWEQGARSEFKVQAVKAFKGESLFKESNFSVSYLKDGYVGQVAMVEFFPDGTDLDAIRAKVTAEAGLMGASVYSLGSAGFAVYSEFFRAPKELSTRSLDMRGGEVAGAQPGIVVQNYVSH